MRKPTKRLDRRKDMRKFEHMEFDTMKHLLEFFNHSDHKDSDIRIESMYVFWPQNKWGGLIYSLDEDSFKVVYSYTIKD